MNYKNILKSTLLRKKESNLATFAIIGGVAVGVALGALFATEKGRAFKEKLSDDLGNIFARLTGKRSKISFSNQLGNLIESVHDHVKLNAEGLLGNQKNQNHASEIQVPNTGTTAWKNQNPKSTFQNEKNSRFSAN